MDRYLERKPTSGWSSSSPGVSLSQRVADKPARHRRADEALCSTATPKSNRVGGWRTNRHAQNDAQTRSRNDEAGSIQLLHLPGIGGECDVDRQLLRGLRAGALIARARTFDWTGSRRGLQALVDVRRHRQQSMKLAQKLIHLRRAERESRIIITSHSAGAGIAAWALETLPDGICIDRWIMLAPALSPTYDLSAALRHVAGEAFAMCSSRDTNVLGTGTRMFGTIDRVYVEAAGYVGFEQPAGADAAAYGKLSNVFYREDWAAHGHDGEHVGALSEHFAREVLAPMIRDGNPISTIPADWR
jgi:pimeloyl-ACP methyl ester carboxylesterase